MKYLITSILFLFSINQAHASASYGVFEWQGSQGTLEFRQLDKNTIQSIDGEYTITYEAATKQNPYNIWLETKRGFLENQKKRVLYASTPQNRELWGAESYPTYLRVKVDSLNQLIVDVSYKNSHVSANYTRGSYPLIHIISKPYLDNLVNESNVAFSETFTDGSNVKAHPVIQNGTALKSLLGKYTLIFEDLGWIEFGPPSHKYNPTIEFNPLREIRVWLEVEQKPGIKKRMHYASIIYNHTQGTQDEYGVYKLDLPIDVIVNTSGILSISAPGEVSYPLGQIIIQ